MTEMCCYEEDYHLDVEHSFRSVVNGREKMLEDNDVWEHCLGTTLGDYIRRHRVVLPTARRHLIAERIKKKI